MSFFIAALLLGAAVSPPPDDDDAPRTRRPPATAPAPDEGDETAPKAAGRTPPKEADEDEQEEGRAQPGSVIVVTARKLDAARTQIDAGLGATVYSLTNETIENRPGGETGSLSDILTQTPGASLSGTTLNLRGSPANQVRINNVIVPEAVSDPTDLLSSRVAETTRVITGTLPAQFGFAPAGVISITTKNGLYQHGGQAEMFAGADGMIEPAFEWTGSVGATSLFASGELEHDHSTVADADGNSARDRRTGIDGLGFADHVIDANNRLSFILGGAHERHRIAATSVEPGTLTDDDAYGVATYQHSRGDFTLQASLFAGFGSDSARFTNHTDERRSSWGTQIDGTDTLGATHTLRFGVLATRSTARELDLGGDRSRAARELDLGGDRSRAARTSVAVYAQDEWKLMPSFTINPGARIEWLRGFGSRAKFEPRASLAWASPTGLTAHLGYARYASGPPVGEQASVSRLPDERDDYVDAGVQQKLGALTIGIDAYSRSTRNFIAEHQVIVSAVPIAFEFQRARMKGVELSGTYARHEMTAWANLSISRAKAKAIVGGDALFAPASLAAASRSYVPLASDRPVIASGGVTQRLGKFSLGADVLMSSGAVRTLRSIEPNGGRRSPYAVLGFAGIYHARIAGHPADLRLDLTNLTNVHYVTSDAANLEGGWTRRGRGRAVTIGIEQGF